MYHVPVFGICIFAITYGNLARQNQFYSDYDGYPLPSSVHLPNVLESKYQVPRERVQEAIDILTENARFAGIMVAGSGGDSRIQLSRDGGVVQRLKQEP